MSHEHRARSAATITTKHTVLCKLWKATFSTCLKVFFTFIVDFELNDNDVTTWEDPMCTCGGTQWDFFTLCSINLNMPSISGTGNVQPVFNLDPCVMKHLWWDIVDNSINSFWCPIEVNKSPQEKWDGLQHTLLFVPMPTHCTITRFGFRARRIDGVECGLFSNHTPLGQTTLRVERVSVQCTVESWG